MENKMTTKIDINSVIQRAPKVEDVDKLFEMFGKEGWMVGKTEIECWISSFPDIFLIADYRGEAIGCVNMWNLSDEFTYIGNFVVDERYRYQGIGTRLWNTSIAKTGSRSLILTSEEFNYDMYKRKGFKVNEPVPIYRVFNVKFREHQIPDGVTIEEATKTNIDELIKYDSTVTTLHRESYLSGWALWKDSKGYVARSNNEIVGYVIACLYQDNMYRVGPLVAENLDIAKGLVEQIRRSFPIDATYTFDTDIHDERIYEIIANKEEMKALDITFIHTKKDVPVNRDKMIFISQVTLTRT